MRFSFRSGTVWRFSTASAAKVLDPLAEVWEELLVRRDTSVEVRGLCPLADGFVDEADEAVYAEAAALFHRRLHTYSEVARDVR